VGLAVQLCALLGMLVAQPSLRITSPTDGATVGKDKQVLDAPPYQFTIEIPPGTRPDKCAVTALGITFAKEFIYSDPIRWRCRRNDRSAR
jgi:hypothetical protein